MSLFAPRLLQPVTVTHHGDNSALGSARTQASNADSGVWSASSLANGTGQSIGIEAICSSTQTLVYGISTKDPLTFAVAPLLLVCVATFACLEPAWRAMRIDPVRALRAAE